MGICCQKIESTHIVQDQSSSISGCSSLEEAYPSVQSVYKIGKVIGGGHFGVVRIGNRFDDPDFKVAIKSISKQKVGRKITRLNREMEILSTVDHPNIIRLYDVYQDSSYIHMVMEYCSGGELFSKIVNQGHFDEKSARPYLYKILLAVNHLHRSKIAHRDLKPENFLFENKSPEAELKLIDFGLSIKFGSELGHMHSKVGTIYYVAPEVLKGNYDLKCDLWSCGVILYSMLSGNFPFFGSNHGEIIQKIKLGEYEAESEIWNGISADAKDLLKGLLCVDLNNRYSAKVALNHAWFKLDFIETIHFNTELLESLRKYRNLSLFQKSVMKLVVKYFNPEEYRGLKDDFLLLDKNKLGYITYEDLIHMLLEISTDLKPDELQEIIRSIDIDNLGYIRYSEFLAAGLSSTLTITENHLLRVFKSLDADCSGYLSVSDIYYSFKKLSNNHSKASVQEMIKDIRTEKRNLIDYVEFKKYFFSSYICK
jgi:calcium-dependent protein kinase